jgi:MtaA/CmuA family methyltransferase
LASYRRGAAVADLKKVNEELNFYIRPQTFPTALRMFRQGEPLPEKVKRPSRDFQKGFANCQTINMVRRYGWTIALTREDSICSLGIIALGFDRELPYYREGNLCEGIYTETAAAGVRSEAAVDKFTHQQYYALVATPLDRCEFEPHLICIYGTPAQVMRLVQAALWKRGGKLTSSFGGRIDCSEIIVTTMKTDECQVILPCSGDRMFGQAQDHEVAFTIPCSRIEEVLEGLRGTHKGGIRYPITQFMEYEARFPPKYMEVNKMWDAAAGKLQYTPRERVVAAYKRSYADGVPAYPILASYAAIQEGYSVRAYCSEAKKAIKAQLNIYEKHRHDVVLAYTDLTKEAEAAGCTVSWQESAVPSISRHVLGEDKGKLARMGLPDPRNAGRLPMFLELCEGLMAARLPTAVGAVVTGPWTVAMLLRGPEALLLDTTDDPEFVREVMRFTTDYIRRFAELVASTKIGLSFAEPTASCSLISPKIYTEFIQPHHHELVRHFQARKVNCTVHICGRSYPLYGALLEVGFGTISIDIDPQVDQLKSLMKVAEKKAVVIGNVNATLFERATKGEIEAEVTRCLETVSGRSGYILSTSCEIPPMSKPEIVQWFMDAARTLGRYRLDGDRQAY